MQARDYAQPQGVKLLEGAERVKLLRMWFPGGGVAADTALATLPYMMKLSIKTSTYKFTAAGVVNFRAPMFRRPLSRLSLIALLLAAPFAHAGPDLPATEAYAAAQAGKMLLIDIRTPEEWRHTGIAPGAGRVDFYRGPQVLLQSVLQMSSGDRTKPVALICHVGVRTTRAQQFLQAQGFTQVYNIKEGMAGNAAGPGWLKRGLPVERCAQC